jgi:hypothetical protein
MKRVRAWLVFALVFCLCRAAPALAQCSSPAGVAGILKHDLDEKVPVYCDGTDWIRMAPEPGQPTDGLVGYWKGDELVTATDGYLDSSRTGAHGTASGNASHYPNEGLDGAIGFHGNGSANRVDIGTNPAFDLATGTISLWFYISDADDANDTGFIAKNSAGNNPGDFFLGLDGSWNPDRPKLRITDSGGTDVAIVADSNITADRWHHLAVTFSSSMTMYFDGALQSDTDTVDMGMQNGAAPLILGNLEVGAIGYMNAGSRLDDVRIYNRVLLPSEITGIYNKRAAVRTGGGSGDFTSDLVGHWSLDQTEGTIAYDSAGSNDGTMVGGLNASAHSVDGVRELALSFDGNDDYIDLGNPPALQFTDDLTIAGWAYFDTFNAGATDDSIVIKRGTSGNRSWEFKATDDCGSATVAMQIYINASNQAEQRCGATTLKTNRWYHFVGVYSAGAQTIDVYLDGEPDNGTLTPGTNGIPAAIHGSSADVTIGAKDTLAAYMEGMMDDLRIYNRALSAEDVKALYLNSTSFCENPNGVPGQLQYDVDAKVPVYCDGAVWAAMDKPGVSNYTPQGVNFDGTNDWLSRDNFGAASDAQQLTGSVWFRTSSGNAWEIFDTDQAAAGGDHSIVINFTGQDGRILINGNNDADATAFAIQYDRDIGLDYSDGNWHHLMFSIDNSRPQANYAHVYVDGAPDENGLDITSWDSSRTIDFDTDNADWISIGRSAGGALAENGDVADFWFAPGHYIDLSKAENRKKFYDNGPVFLGRDGKLPTGTAPAIFLTGDTDNWHVNQGTGGIFFESGALSNASVHPGGGAAPYTQSLVTDPALMGYWPFDEPGESTAIDFSGGNDGSLINGVIFDSSGGRINGAASFDGADDYIRIRNTDGTGWDLADENLTFSVWFKASSTQTDAYPRFIDRFTGGPNTGYRLGLDSEGDNIQFVYGDASGGDQASVTTAGTYNDNAWHHVAVTMDGTVARLYMDGVYDSQDAYSILADHTADITFGGSYNSNSFDGLLDDFRIYHRALSAAEITRIFDAGTNGKSAEDCANPDAAEGVLVYNLDENAVQYCDGAQWNILGK